jgi:hypothetical protein
MHDITRISPVTDAEAARLVSKAALADLASEIMATPPPAGRLRGQRPRSSRRRMLLAGVPLAAFAGAAVLLVTVFGRASDLNINPAVNNSKAAMQALSFTREHGYIKVIVRNPLADASWYDADFARHHMNIKLELVPVSPSLVGTVVMIDTMPGTSNFSTITAQGRCWTGGGGSACPVGLKVPLNFHGQALITFGRAAKPGEQYESVGSAFSPGEALQGLRSQVIVQPVRDVWPLLAEHHVTIASCRDADNSDINPSQVPGNWYVTDVLPWAPGQVLVQVGPQPVYSGG